MEEKDALAALSALSNETRLRILRRLVMAGEAGLTAGEIATAVEASPSRASFHLSHMADAGLVASTRAARQVTYRAGMATMNALIRYLWEDCCQGQETLQTCCTPHSTRGCQDNDTAL